VDETEPTTAFTLPRRGSRVQLRAWRVEDVDTFRAWHQPYHAWHRTNGPYFPARSADDIDRVATRARERVASGDTTQGDRHLVVADLDGAYLGTVNRYAIDSTGWTAIGVGIHDDQHWGLGYGGEAFGLWVDLLFESEPELHRLDARTWSGHTAMMRVADRHGFTLEARHREARVVDGERYDALGYGLLRREWQARR
jgi:putative hydrolase of HD superfamily